MCTEYLMLNSDNKSLKKRQRINSKISAIADETVFAHEIKFTILADIMLFKTRITVLRNGTTLPRAVSRETML